MKSPYEKQIERLSELHREAMLNLYALEQGKPLAENNHLIALWRAVAVLAGEQIEKIERDDAEYWANMEP